DNTTATPAFTPLIDPVHEYSHAVGQSITGGFVYRGHALGPMFRGRYFFADYVARRVWSIVLTPSGSTAVASHLIEHTAELGGSGAIGNISSCGVDLDGELYVVSHSLGRIFRLFDSTQEPRARTDFDGDARADLAVYRAASGNWLVQNVTTTP